VREVENENDLSSILRSSEKVFALFYASWCPFCRSFLPVFEVYTQKKGDNEFLRVKIDDEMNPLWEKYDVKVVPTVILFKGERKLKRLDGVLGRGLSEKQLKEFLVTS